MSLTQDVAAEQYQLACDALMEIAEDYNASDEASSLALAAAQKLTTDYIDKNLDDINTLNRHYELFIESMERVISDLGKTTIERLLIEPLTQRLQTAKGITTAPKKSIWEIRWEMFLRWMKTRNS